MNTQRLNALLRGLLGLTIATLASCEEPIESVEVATPSVKVFKVGKTATGQSRRFSGKIKAGDRTTLSFGISGQVIEILAGQGQAIAKGDLLARLDDEPNRIKVKEARASLSTARAQLVESQTDFDRTSGLVQKQALPQKQLDAATSDLATAQGRLQTAEAELDQAEINLERTRITAPFGGKIVEVPIVAFQEVSASAAAVVLQSKAALEIEVRVPETMIRNVEFGLGVTVDFPALEDVSIDGTVVEIGAEAEVGNAFRLSSN